MKGAVRCVAAETRFWGSSKPSSCLTSRKQTSKGQRQVKVVRISVGRRVRSVEKKQSSRRRPPGSRTTTTRRSRWPALEYHSASTDLYQTLTLRPYRRRVVLVQRNAALLAICVGLARRFPLLRGRPRFERFVGTGSNRAASMTIRL